MIDRLSPRQVFAADAVGALFTALLLGLVLVRFADAFGLGERIFHLLAGIAAVLCLYSTTMALTNRPDWRPWLRVIAAANLGYCLMTFTMVVIARDEITLIGGVYFVGEALLIAGIAAFEWRYAARPADPV